MKVGEMVGLSDIGVKSEIDAAMSRIKKINEELMDIDDTAADCECAYFRPSVDGGPAECELMTNLYCKAGKCPLVKDTEK